MRLREPLLLTGVLGLAVAVACVTSVWTSIDRAQVIQAMAITRTITIDPAVHETFGPPSDAAPAITPSQAFSQYELEMGRPSVAAIPPNVKVHLGLLTFPVGPYCGAECGGYVVQNGIAYHALHELAWGYSSYDCRVGSHKSARQCTAWTFLDATTGNVLDMVRPRRGTSHRP